MPPILPILPALPAAPRPPFRQLTNSSLYPDVGTPLYADLPSSFNVHPFLDGETPGRDFMFSLTSEYFSPMRIIDGHDVPLSPETLAQPATYPPIYRLRIVCDEIPEWPITLEFDPDSYYEQTGTILPYVPPISLGDALFAIHRMLQEQITYSDWARLHTTSQTEITKAYITRCKSMPTMESLLKSHGVKKVDYLLNRVWFDGLARTGDGPEVLRLVVSRRQ